MNDGPDLTTYAELAELLEQLPMIVREARRAQRVTLRVVADETGLSPSTLSRLDRGNGEISLGGAIAILRWLDQAGSSEVDSDS